MTINNNGQIKAVSAGTATITAASHKNPEVNASCTVQVLAPNYTFRGLLTADNQVQTFEWNLADSETWEKVAAVDGNRQPRDLGRRFQRKRHLCV